jgi:hypothetical protein
MPPLPDRVPITYCKLQRKAGPAPIAAAYADRRGTRFRNHRQMLAKSATAAHAKYHVKNRVKRPWSGGL